MHLRVSLLPGERRGYDNDNIMAYSCQTFTVATEILSENLYLRRVNADTCVFVMTSGSTDNDQSLRIGDKAS